MSSPAADYDAWLTDCEPDVPCIDCGSPVPTSHRGDPDPMCNVCYDARRAAARNED